MGLWEGIGDSPHVPPMGCVLIWAQRSAIGDFSRQRVFISRFLAAFFYFVRFFFASTISGNYFLVNFLPF